MLHIESRLLKFQNFDEKPLTSLQKKVSQLLLNKETGGMITIKDRSFIELAAKRLESSGEQKRFFCFDTCFRLPTSNMCKRFFFILKFAMTNRLKVLLPGNVELQLFFCVNREFWSTDDVKQLVMD